MAIKRVTGSIESQKRRWTEDDAAAVLGVAASSGLTLAQFANQQGVELQRLERWRRRLGFGDAASNHKQPPVAFEEVEAPLRAPAGGGRMEVVLRGGRVVRVDADFDADAVRRLIAVLEGPSC